MSVSKWRLQCRQLCLLTYDWLAKLLVEIDDALAWMILIRVNAIRMNNYRLWINLPELFKLSLALGLDSVFKHIRKCFWCLSLEWMVFHDVVTSIFKTWIWVLIDQNIAILVSCKWSNWMTALFWFGGSVIKVAIESVFSLVC